MVKVFIFAVCSGIAIYACGSNESPQQSQNFGSSRTTSSTPIQSINVTALYNDTCAKCHGETGGGGGAGTRTLNTIAKYDQKNDRPFFDAIKNGVPDMGMDAYGATMNDATVWSMVVHIRELQAKSLRSQFGSPRSAGGVYSTQHTKFSVEDVVTTGLSTPWSVDWLADGTMLVTNRPGGMYLYRGGTKIADIEGLPASVEQGQGGLMEVSVHSSGWVYLSIADPAKSGQGAMTKIVRGKINNGTWSEQQTIYEADQKYYSRAGQHFGSKIVFDNSGHVYFSVGERGTNIRVQREDDSPYGKIMRLNLDGTVPSDNPIAGNPMWSTGHRNPQGLVIDLEGIVWDTEHGPRGGDEVNLIAKGANYGWPLRALSNNYNDSPFVSPWNGPGENFVFPVFRWLPSIGASGMDVINGNAFPAWKGDIIAGGLSGNNLDRFRMKDGVMVEHEELLHGMGRVRDIAVHKDGTIYIVLNGPDKVFRLAPAK